MPALEIEVIEAERVGHGASAVGNLEASSHEGSIEAAMTVCATA